MWDALNHVTGAANVRLHHCERRGALQMIATRDIDKGGEVAAYIASRPSLPRIKRRPSACCLSDLILAESEVQRR